MVVPEKKKIQRPLTSASQTTRVHLSRILMKFDKSGEIKIVFNLVDKPKQSKLSKLTRYCQSEVIFQVFPSAN